MSPPRLHDPEGRLRARVEYPDWWFLAGRDRALRLADPVMEQTGPDALSVEESDVVGPQR